jgi:glucose/arabinose dehydrogenase
VAAGLTFPTAVAVDDQGTLYVVEAGYSYGEAFVSQGGTTQGGRIVKVSLDGKLTPLVEQLPSYGDHQTHGPAIGPDGMIYFGVGTAQSPATGRALAPVGLKVVRVNVANGVIEEFAVNRGDKNGPASMLKNHGFERPLSVRFGPDGSALYVVDFGVLAVSDKGLQPVKQAGSVWRIVRDAGVAIASLAPWRYALSCLPHQRQGAGPEYSGNYSAVYGAVRATIIVGN